MDLLENELKKYRALWTTEKSNYVIFTVRSYGEVECLIFHKPTRRVTVAKSLKLERRIIQNMLRHGVPLLDDPPA